MAHKRRSLTFDETEAFHGALEYQVDEKVFVTNSLKRFIELKSKQHSVEPRMFIPSMLGVISNAMGLAQVTNLCLII